MVVMMMSLGISNVGWTNPYGISPSDWEEILVKKKELTIEPFAVSIDEEEVEYIDNDDNYVTDDYIDAVVNEIEEYDPHLIEDEVEDGEPYIEEPYEEEPYEEYIGLGLIDRTTSSSKVILGNKKLYFEELEEEEHSKTITSLTMVKYNNKSRYVKYYYRDYILIKKDGIIDVTVRRYSKLITSGDSIANRKNNPGNITCSSGKRRLAYTILSRNASDKGDAKSCIYASKELGMRDYKNLLSSDRYNNAPIKKAFKKYQSSVSSFKAKLRALVKAGVNINRTYNSLSKNKKEVFAEIYAKYEGWKTTDNSIIIELGVDHLSLENDEYELNSYLLDDKYNQVITKIVTERYTSL